VSSNPKRGRGTGQVASRGPAVQRGQTAMLTWEQGGIRVVLPVTCLEAGAAGQFVLVRFQNAPRTVRAEVVGAGEVRVSL
jgi:flagella basal body P-ring formation protein FlgA